MVISRFGSLRKAENNLASKLLHSSRVLINDELTDASILIEGGKIQSVSPGISKIDSTDFFDLGDKVVMPGLVDCHVHINEPGRTEWEGFKTATLAAAAGGITTLVDMPLNSSPVTITADSFKKKLQATKGKLHVNCGFWGGLVSGNLDDLEKLLDAGVLGIKAFLTHSGIDEFPNVTADDLKKAMPIIAKYTVPLLVHAELDTRNKEQENLKRNPTNYQAYLDSRPKHWEDNAIEMMIRLCEKTGCQTHIVHLSSANSIAQIAKAKKRGLPISTETCPHYLVFNADNIPNGPGSTIYKCAPPIRERENNEQLGEALKNGIIDFVVTDHCPCTPSLKELESGDFLKAWGGISSLQFSLSAMWTWGLKNGLSIADISRLMSKNTANFCNWQNRKGRITPGYDADLVVFDPHEKFTVSEEQIFHRHKLTPYLGVELCGTVQQTFVNGEIVYDSGEHKTRNVGEVLLSRRN